MSGHDAGKARMICASRSAPVSIFSGPHFAMLPTARLLGLGQHGHGTSRVMKAVQKKFSEMPSSLARLGQNILLLRMRTKLYLVFDGQIRFSELDGIRGEYLNLCMILSTTF